MRTVQPFPTPLHYGNSILKISRPPDLQLLKNEILRRHNPVVPHIETLLPPPLENLLVMWIARPQEIDCEPVELKAELRAPDHRVPG